VLKQNEGEERRTVKEGGEKKEQTNEKRNKWKK